MPKRPVHTKVADLPRETLFGGSLERCAVRGDGSLVTFNWIRSGSDAPPPHSHPFDQLSFVLQGQMRFEVGTEKFLLGPGEVLAIPADAPHTATIVGEETVLNVDVFAPVRDDYLYLTDYSAEAFQP